MATAPATMPKAAADRGGEGGAGPPRSPRRHISENDIIFSSCNYFSTVGGGGLADKLRAGDGAVEAEVKNAPVDAPATAETSGGGRGRRDGEGDEQRNAEPSGEHGNERERGGGGGDSAEQSGGEARGRSQSRVGAGGDVGAGADDARRDRGEGGTRADHGDRGDPVVAVSPEVEASLKLEIASEKQGYLLELVKFKKQGVDMTRSYTMEDSLGDIQFEYDRIRTQLETVNNVNMIRDGLMFGFQGLEFANKRFGPILQLDGWSREVQKDKAKYNLVIERLYKKHWRYGNMSPETEFGWLIASSMLMHHFKRKFIGGGAPAREDSNDNDDDDDDDTYRNKSKSKRGATAVASKSGFDLSSLMSGMLPKFPGFAPPASVSPRPTSSSSSSSASASAPSSSARPIMRAPQSQFNDAPAHAPAPAVPISIPGGTPNAFMPSISGPVPSSSGFSATAQHRGVSIYGNQFSSPQSSGPTSSVEEHLHQAQAQTQAQAVHAQAQLLREQKQMLLDQQQELVAMQAEFANYRAEIARQTVAREAVADANEADDDPPPPVRPRAGARLGGGREDDGKQISIVGQMNQGTGKRAVKPKSSSAGGDTSARPPILTM